MTAVGIRSVLDLLLQLPRRYEDRAGARSVAAVQEEDGPVLVRGCVVSVRAVRGRSRRGHRCEAVVEDEGARLRVVWFHLPWIAQRIPPGTEVCLYGRPRCGRGGALELHNPELSLIEEGENPEAVVPVHGRVGSLAGRRVRTLMTRALVAGAAVKDPLPEPLRRELGLPELGEALTYLHAPPCPAAEADRAALVEALNTGDDPWHRRLAFDELLGLAATVAACRRQRRDQAVTPLAVAPARLDRWQQELVPFTLTGAQRRVLELLLGDLRKPHAMARLLQGDVGSGKTVVAALLALAVLEAGRQVALMAPTELLAEQHHRTLTELLARAGRRPALLIGSLPAAKQREVRAAVAVGEVELVVGTHALIQSSVDFRRLGLVVVDEQQRFGVAQRQALLAKGSSPHLLVMTATPIPRSLALTVHGDLDLVVLDELPPGRHPVRTVIRERESWPRLGEFITEEVGRGARAYVVYPRINDDATSAVRSLTSAVEHLRTHLPGVVVGALHGRLRRDERDRVVEDFRAGRIEVLAATTVVEVGVDVPEATVMVIESPQHFGLSQLHQLRGRVGRGDRPSWCVLLADEETQALSPASRRRLQVLVDSHDGFAIAESDLELRGPGELTGLRQWGSAGLRFADLAAHRDLVELAQQVAARLAASGDLEHVRAALTAIHATGKVILSS